MKPCALFRRQILALLAFALVICGAPAARATDTFNGTTLTIPVLSIGLYEYANVVVTAGLQDIVVRPSGTSPLGGADIYRSASRQLYIPAVTFGSNTYYNMTITPETLVSIGGLVYGDTFNGTDLFIPYVIVPGARLSNVILEVTTANILSIGGGLPTVDYDTYANGQLHIPAVQVGNNVYTNVILSVGPGNIVYPISGNVSGLAAGQQVTLVDSTGGTVTVSANRAFMLPIALHPGTQYDVTVQSQPNASFCTIANGSGTMTSAGAAVTVGCGVKTDSFPTVGSYTWTVPVGVTSIQAVVTGAGGGGNTLGSVGGSGAIVTANLSVTPGEVLNLVVGGGGGIGNSSPSAQGGAGGGGASSIGYGTPATGGQILIVAGAGGGAGDGGDSPSGFVGTGATGGDTGVGTNSSSTPQIFDGTAGTSYGSGASGFGGGAVGNAVAGGSGGASSPTYTSPVGYPGSAGFGGAGGTGGGGGPNGNAGYGAGGGTGGLSTSGGGGGGGAGGGGGGGKLPPDLGGGGGGGGTLVPAGGSAVLANNGSGVTGGAGSIVINY